MVGDPAHTLELLWREPGNRRPKRGPKQSRSVEDIVAAAIALADATGLDGVTIRSVADVVGMTSMSIYTYVPGKAKLLDLMLDTVYLAMPRPPLRGRDWRDRLTAVAEDNRALFREHPWVATMSTARPPLGPGLMAKYEHELSAFDGLGLDDATIDSARAYLLGFVQANARAAVDARTSGVESALSDREWWAANAPLLARVFDPASYPTAARIGATPGAGHDPERAYRFGLARTLDGLATLIDHHPVTTTP